MSAFGSPNPVRNTFYIFKACFQPNPLVIPNLFILNTLRTMTPFVLRKHSMRVSLPLSIMTISYILNSTVWWHRSGDPPFHSTLLASWQWWNVPSLRPASHGIPPVLFCRAGPDIPLLLPNLLSPHVPRKFFVIVEDLHYCPKRWKWFLAGPWERSP